MDDELYGFAKWYSENGFYHDTVSPRRKLMRLAWNAAIGAMPKGANSFLEGVETHRAENLASYICPCYPEGTPIGLKCDAKEWKKIANDTLTELMALNKLKQEISDRDIRAAMPQAQVSKISLVDTVTERCIADDQWAIDAFYEGYDKANANFKANGFSGLKPIIGGVRSLLTALNTTKQEAQGKYTLSYDFVSGYKEGRNEQLKHDIERKLTEGK